MLSLVALVAQIAILAGALWLVFWLVNNRKCSPIAKIILYVVMGLGIVWFGTWLFVASRIGV